MAKQRLTPGQAQERLRQLLAASRADPSIKLDLDELHDLYEIVFTASEASSKRQPADEAMDTIRASARRVQVIQKGLSDAQAMARALRDDREAKHAYTAYCAAKDAVDIRKSAGDRLGGYQG